ncbi:helix-turn-helix domain-containing protein [Govanella unica]|uniref:Helix-turn-helix domain-containing protein n=1 Tax=Govanella unica TaxID=2975056 RepID=A0A9X3TX15_9PROT|nr:helix-turn-helix domain-containing protein [Govania unica]MDA5193331.1 helix-turn-helix domain-containing protein [Govania unica]
MSETLDSDFHEDFTSKQEDYANIFVGLRIRERRKARGMNQQDLATALGCRYQQIQKYEKGVNRIGVGKLAAFARALDVPTSYFLEGLDDTLGQSRDGLRDQPQASWVMDQDVIDLVQNFSRLENPSSRKQITGMVEHLVSIESFTKAIK